MRSPGTVYKKLKEVKYRHLAIWYGKYFKRIPDNCKYNYRYVFSGEGSKAKKEIRLCLLHQESVDLKKGVIPHLVDVCEEQSHSAMCNGFVYKYSKEDIKGMFEAELKDRKIREKKYPDICALEWVLERSVVGIPPLNWTQEIYYYVKRVILKNKIL